MLLQNEYYIPGFNIVEREDVEGSIEEIIKPHDEFLLSKGFVYQSTLVYDNPQYGLELDHYLFYYYNHQNGVHAFINTMPEILYGHHFKTIRSHAWRSFLIYVFV